jgi:TnpA family transposase
VSPGDGRTRDEVLGEPLTPAEVRALVKPHISHNRQLNIGNNYTDCHFQERKQLNFFCLYSFRLEIKLKLVNVDRENQS